MPPSQSYPLSDLLTLLAGSLGHFVPELVLTAGLLLMVLAELIWGKKYPGSVPLLGLIVVLASGGILLIQGYENPFTDPAHPEVLPFLNMVVPDGFSWYFRLLFVLTGILTIGTSYFSETLRKVTGGKGEYYLVVMGMLLGMYLMSMARNLLMMYLALELVSISSYILTAYTRSSRKSAEASLKYFIYGAFSSGFMIYGISWLYGITGTLDPGSAEFTARLGAADPAISLVMLLFVLAGFAYKVSAVPFHFWAPDVYEGAPFPVAAFFSVGPKAAGFAMLIRFVHLTGTEGPLRDHLVLLLGLMAIVSMTLGNLAALQQQSLRRMIAYSGIAQAGYLLLGVLCFSTFGFASVAFYLTVYLCMTFGLFLVAGIIQEQTGSDSIDSLKGMAGAMPLITVLSTLFLVSLTGLPPTGGFIAKLYIFLAVFENAGNSPFLLTLLVAAILNTVVSLYYYLRVPVVLIFSKSAFKNRLSLHGFYQVILVILALPVLVLGVFGFDKLVNFIQVLLTTF
ncbi:MAG: NADH-quinone oxidoreductase subunit N [Bacteroidia bacterium]|nr:NADH-quinone oxidoreductase subunit N [Bacteroidia bacterium]